MSLFKDDDEIDKKNSMSDFLFSANIKNKASNKSSTLMFGGDYSNNKHSVNNEAQKNEHKKIPMFGDNSSNVNNINKNDNLNHTFDITMNNSKPYNVVNSEHQKMLIDLRTLVDSYTNIFSDDDKKKICFLIDKLKSEM